jgi:hypothetical protein
MDSGLAAIARRRRALMRWWPRTGMTKKPTLRRPFLVRARVALSRFPSPSKEGMERREAPGACEAPLTPLAIGASRAPRTTPAVSPQAHPVVRTGLRIPPRGARALRWRVCEAHHPDAAPPGAPPRAALSAAHSLPAFGSRHDSEPRASTDAMNVSPDSRAGITYFFAKLSCRAGRARFARLCPPYPS